MYNRTEIIGFLGNDADIRDVAENRKVISLRIGTTSHYLSGGKPVNHTEWFNCEAFCSGKQAGYFARHARKGALVHACGETRTQTWIGTDRIEHSKAVVLASISDVHLLKPPAAREATPPAAQEATFEKATSLPPLPADDARMDLMDFDD